MFMYVDAITQVRFNERLFFWCAKVSGWCNIPAPSKIRSCPGQYSLQIDVSVFFICMLYRRTHTRTEGPIFLS